MTAPCPRGITICADRATPAILLANCTLRDGKAITASVEKSSPARIRRHRRRAGLHTRQSALSRQNRRTEQSRRRRLDLLAVRRARCAEHAQRWLADHQNDDKPWAVFLNFVCPHPPYIAPPDIYERYEAADIALPPPVHKGDLAGASRLDYFRRFFSMEDGHDEETLRRVAAAYMGTTTYLDQQIGAVLDWTGWASATARVICSSDHGECLGARGLFGKFTTDEAAAVPLIAAGPDVPEGHVVETPVSLVDIFPTALECVGADAPEAELPGRSLWLTANEDDAERTVLSEYHALGTEHACFMLRRRRYKYLLRGCPTAAF